MGEGSKVITDYALSGWAGFGWPHMAFFSVLFFCIFFRKHISKLFDRVSKISASGAEFANAPSPIDVQSAPEVPSENPSTGGDPESTSNSPPVRALGHGIPLAPFGVNHTRAIASGYIEQEIINVPESDLKDYLVSHLSMMRVLWDFESIYSAIFGGQIALLKHLNVRMLAGVSKQEVEALWDDHKASLAPHLDQWALDQYLNFLFLRALIEVNGTNYRISIKGHEFLVWMTQCSKPEEKQW
ncbi:hypothetical protein [Pseudomonas hunanensis]|uniref:hypothetical protein n=1 Tax=Pseudomonas hunanensis TaxID=1247546 RepID=UPI0015B94F36|nr:hypothetical protein [Pseudomonas hunanensis]